MSIMILYEKLHFEIPKKKKKRLLDIQISNLRIVITLFLFAKYKVIRIKPLVYFTNSVVNNSMK